MKLKDCCICIADGDHQPPPKANAGVPFVTISNIDAFNTLDFENAMHVPREYYDGLDPKRRATTGDVLYSVVGSFGIPVLIKDETPFVFQRHIAILRPNKAMLDSRFLYYAMRGKEFYDRADAAAIGAAQRTISLSALKNLEIPLPPIPVQQGIADILSAYDDLIENNRKQIKLREEAAQRLYKEWFIDLRFPGYKHTPIINGIPEGWKKILLSNLIEIKYGKDHKGIADGNIPVYGSGGLMRKCCKALFVGEAVLIPRKGSLNNKMYVNESFWTVDTMFYAIPKRAGLGFCVYFFLRTLDMYSLDIGSAVPSMTTNILNSLEMLLPTQNSLDKFQQTVYVYFQQISLLRNQKDKLAEARDRLLNKLLGGKLAT